MRTVWAEQDLKKVNNEYYHSLTDAWYSASDNPVALLRAESNLRNPWVVKRLQEFFYYREDIHEVAILDVGCGGGFLSNFLGHVGYKVTGLDLSASSLETAAKHDKAGTVNYVQGDAYQLPFGNESFDAVTCMDFLEHVGEPERVLAEIQRVLKPNGFFFFHTFSKNILSDFVVIKLVKMFVKNTPKDLHAYELFISPSTLYKWMNKIGLKRIETHGIRPAIFQLALLKLAFTGKVPKNFKFVWSFSSLVSYCGVARKLVSVNEPKAPEESLPRQEQ